MYFDHSLCFHVPGRGRRRLDLDELLSGDARRMEPSPIRELAKRLRGSDIISLAGGQPSPEAFPLEEIRQVLLEFVGTLQPEVLQYGRTAGNEELREYAVRILSGKGIGASVENVVLCNGSQRGLDLVGRIVLDPGDVVVMEVPTYSGAIACFRNLQAELVGIAQDAEGMRTGDLERTVKKLQSAGKRVKLVYTIPTFQNPSGATMSAARRAELVEMARSAGLLILEDDPYSDLFFDEAFSPERLPPVAGIDPSRVAYLSTFSKVLAPGLRTAFMHGPPWLMRKIELAAQASDLSAGTLDQRFIVELCRSGVLTRSIEKARELYSSHCRALQDALTEFMPAAVTWSRPHGGLFMWVELPEKTDALKMLDEALETGVAYVPGSCFCVDGSGGNALRLCFAEQPPKSLRLGAAALATTLRLWDIKDKVPWAFGTCERKRE